MADILNATLEGLRRALVESPQNGHIWLQVAELLAALGRDQEAIEAAKEALARLTDGESRARAEAIVPKPEPPPEDSNVLRLVHGGRAPTHVGIGDRERITFADVGGLDEVKDQVRMRIILPFQRPDLYQAYGKRTGGGMLFYGPPGCGKTLLARAMAGECGASFHNVTIDSVLDMYYGESERRLAELFTSARERTPAVLFFDEVEAIGANRQQIRNSPGKSLVNQLLSEMDGVAASNEKVLVVGATNAPWSVDPALRRPGRFDRVVFIPPPDEPARLEILRIHLKSKPVDNSIDLGSLARKTVEFSGADLLALGESASDIPLREALRTGVVRPISQSDFVLALKTQKPTAREWFATAKNYATFANTGGLYDDLLSYLSSRK